MTTYQPAVETCQHCGKMPDEHLGQKQQCEPPFGFDIVSHVANETYGLVEYCASREQGQRIEAVQEFLAKLWPLLREHGYHS